MLNIPLLPAVYLTKLTAIMDEEGLPTRHVLKECGLGPDLSVFYFGTNVSINQIRVVIQHYLKLTAEKNPGFKYGLELDSSAHGFLGYSYFYRGNTLSLIRDIVTYLNIRIPIMPIKISEEEGRIYVFFKAKHLPDDIKDFLIQAYLTSFYKMASMIIPKIKIKTVENRFTLSDSVKNFFKDSIVGVGEQDELIYFTENNNIPGSLKDSIQADGFTDIPDIVLRLRQLIVRNNKGFINAEQAAIEMGMSERTLRRKLAENGYCFRAIRQEMLKNTALRYLQNSSLSIERIAEQCSYSDQSSFTKAFQKWQGTTPDAIRKKGVI